MIQKIIIENDLIKMEILPEQGGKITSLYNKTKQSEWLYQQVSDAGEESVSGVFGKSDAFGFDEMFPTINKQLWNNISGEPVELPDHGEIWSKKWSVLHSNETSLLMEVKGGLFPYVFRRKIELLSSEIHISYSVENLSSFSIPFLWTPHPLFSFSRNTEILVPDVLEAIRQAGDGGALGDYNTIYQLGKSGLIDNIGTLLYPGKLPEGSALKFYSSEPLQEGYCGLKDERGTLEMIFDEGSIPWLGFWINNGGRNGQYNLALEPATAPMDSPGAAEKLGVPASLSAYEKKEWKLNIIIT